jgi:glycosyltransferase involved in cell wall biosynthesis
MAMPTAMNILYIVPYVPSPIRVRPYQLVRALLRRGHRVTLAAVWTSGEERADLGALAASGIECVQAQQPRWRSAANSLGALVMGTPLQAAYSWQPEFAGNLRRLVQERRFDVVHVEHLRGARYGVDLLPAARRMQAALVWDSVDCISHLFEQAAAQSSSLRGKWMARLELERTRRYEGWLVQQFDQVVVTSPADRAALAQLAGAAAAHSTPQDTAENTAAPQTGLHQKISVTPNGVDLDYFWADESARKPASIVFTGKMSYHANVTAAVHLVNDIMPRVWAQRDDVEVWIVGKDPTAEVRRLASRRVLVTGTVPDLRPYLHRASVAVAPMPYGAGIQNKVLEAMACATPVVASRQAASALEAHAGQDLLVADGPEQFAEAICALLANPQHRGEMAARGRAYVETHHSWDAAATRLEQVYRRAHQGQEIMA